MWIPGKPMDGPAYGVAFKDGGGKTQTVQNNDPWKPAQPFIQYGLDEARGVYDTGAPGVFPGQTLAGVDPYQDMALDWTGQRAMAGNPITSMAQGHVYDTLNGDFLGAGNPYFSAMSDNIANEVTKGVNSTFGGAGRWGSGAHANALSSSLSDKIGNLAFENFVNERQNMLGAASAAPALAQSDYYDIAQLGQVGDARRGLEQGFIDDDVSRYNAEQNQPWDALGRYNSLIQGNYGGTTTATQPRQGGSMATGLLGGGLGGAGIASALGMSTPWGAALAGGGALLGLLGSR